MGSARKSSALMLSALGAVALLSVGFASWEIRNSELSSSVSSGSISADEVIDKRLKLVDTGTWSGNPIYFGAPANRTNSGKGWLTVSDNSTTENLTATYTFKVACPDDKKDNLSVTVNDFKAICSDSSSDTTAWSTATTDKYIDVNPTLKGEKTNTTETNATTYPGMTICICTATITFKWGSHFSITGDTSKANLNPYVYYNSLEYSDKNAEDAKTALEAIKNAAENTTFSFKITVKVN